MLRVGNLEFEFRTLRRVGTGEPMVGLDGGPGVFELRTLRSIGAGLNVE